MKIPARQNPRRRAGRYLLCLAVVVCATGATWFEARYSQPPLQKFKQLPDFELTDSSGKTLGLADLKGKVWLADFIYTTCPGSCPMLSSRLSALQGEALKDDAVRFVSVSVNPTHDTPEVLRQYAQRFQAEPGKWIFLTGDQMKVSELVNGGFLLGTGTSQTATGEMVHSTKLVLVDKNGVIRAYYDGTTGDETQHILRDIRRLLRE